MKEIERLERKIRAAVKKRDGARKVRASYNAQIAEKELRALKREYKAIFKRSQMVLPGFELGGQSDAND